MLLAEREPTLRAFVPHALLARIVRAARAAVRVSVLAPPFLVRQHVARLGAARRAVTYLGEVLAVRAVIKAEGVTAVHARAACIASACTTKQPAAMLTLLTC